MPDNKLYELLAEISQNSPSHGLTNYGLASDDPRVMQGLTTAYITTMYHSALSNLQLQDIMPADIDESPRLKIAFERTYADYIAAKKWLDINGGEFISNSPAKDYYKEVNRLPAGSILNVADR